MSDALNQKLANLSPAKLALLKKKLAAKKAAEANARPATGIPVLSDRKAGLPLSFAQRRLWFLDRLDPGGTAYNLAHVMRLPAGTEAPALARALARLAERHEVLRTVFEERAGEPCQLIRDEALFEVPSHDLRGQAKGEDLCRQLLDGLMAQAFDLATGPLLRAALVQLDDAVVALFVFHHIVTDAWSARVFETDLLALLSGKALPALPVQYADFAAWQADQLMGENKDKLLNFWRARLADNPPPTELPADRPRPALQQTQGAKCRVQLPADLSAAILAAARAEGVSPFMWWAAALNALLFRYGNRDISLGTPVAGRDRNEVAGLIGFFVNTLVLRNEVHGSASFRQLLAGVKDTSLAAFAHGDMPFEMMVEALQPERDQSRPPFFSVMFSYESEAGGDDARLLALLERDRVEAKFDLTLLVLDFGGRFHLELEYATALFDRATIERLLGHLQQLAHGIAADMDRTLAQLPLLQEAERLQILEAWHPAPVDHRSQTWLHQRFEQQAAARPEAIALSLPASEGAARIDLSYGELDRRANFAARRLTEAGIGAEDLVGLCLERSPELVIGILAVLKAGAAYLPLDPSVPADRFEFIKTDAGMKLLLSAGAVAERPELAGVPLQRLDEPGELAQAPEVAIDGEQPAYVIYTSGSTGKPKGVLVTHGNANRLFTATDADFGFGHDDVWTLFHSYAFDFSVWELWGALAYGGRLVIVPYLISRDPAIFLDLLAEERVTVLNQTPSAFNQLIAADAERELDLALRYVVFGGEALDVRALAPWFAKHGELQPQLINMYGITETTVHVTYAPLRADGRRGDVGRAIADLEIHILDPHGNPVPIGVSGELHIGGDGLARGYLKRPALTAQRFIPHPFAHGPGMRLYRSGDLGRYRADGRIEYMGRLDHQVKIRGFRIELGEIEHELLACEPVREVVVLPHGKGAEQRLVAWLVPTDGCDDEGALVATLREQLGQNLPDYMVPAAFVVMERFPLTVNGKLDRRALPEPDLRGQQQYVAPQAGTESIVAEIWTEILGVARVGAADHFFELGGFSLMATRVFSRLRERFARELPLRLLFNHPVLREFARAIDAADAAESALPPITPAPADAPRPLSLAQQRLWLLDKIEGPNATYNMPFGMSLSGPLDARALHAAIGAIAERHEVLRTHFPADEEGQPQQLIAADYRPTLNLLDISGLDEAAAATVLAGVNADLETPFALGSLPLIRLFLVRLGDADHLLLGAMHHIISDGWSVGLLFSELAALYRAQLDLTDAAPAPLPIQYRDFALAQRLWLQGERLQQQLNFWKDQLDDAPALLTLPTDHARPKRQRFAGAIHSFSLSPELSARLHQLADQRGATLFMTLQAAFSVLLSRLSGQSDVVIGTPVANRNRREIEGLIGFFVNTLVLRNQVDGELPFAELLAETKRRTLDAFAHGDVPFEQVVDAVNPERSLAYNPLFQVMFVLQNAHSEALALPLLQCEALPPDHGTAKFDLTLEMAEENDHLSAALEFNTDLFEQATVLRIAGYWRNLLHGLTTAPELGVGHLNLMGDDELQRLLVHWNHTERYWAQPESLLALIENQIDRASSNEAVIFHRDGDWQRLDYAALDRRANRLAHHLLSLGAGTEQRIGVCLERSLDLVTALLAVLKTGAAYVPIDPEYPQDRIDYMCEDSRAGVIICNGASRSLLGSHELLDLDGFDWEQGSDQRPLVSIQALQPAYTIYTSGTTGRPKGAVNTHVAICNRLLWMQDAFGLDGSDRVLQKTPFSFDVSVWEFFWPMITGAALVVAEPGGHKDPAYLIRTIEAQAVTTLHFVPSMLNLFLAELEVGRCASLRRVICSGEALPYDSMQRFAAKSAAELHNLYGPTEAAIDVTWHACGHDEPEGIVPIGRPIANTELYIVDRFMRPVPTGVAGELLLGGVNLARGYHARPGLTADRFVPCAFAGEGTRLYRTGDLVSYLPNGSVAFLGRVDHQVKLRGFRIELGEIEAVLAEHERVDQAVVMLRRLNGQDTLVAYVVAKSDCGGADLEEILRTVLRSRLPEFFVPGAFVMLDKMPLSPNGKVARRRLPVPKAAVTSARVMPRGELEARILDIWERVLGRAGLGVTDSFFSVGGNSLGVAQVASRLRRDVGVEVPVADLFEHATVADLAAHIQRLEGSEPLPPIGPRQDLTPARLSYAQERLWFLEELEGASASYHLPLAVRLQGNVDVALLRAALEQLALRHPMLRTTFVSVEEDPCQIVVDTVEVPLQQVDLRQLGEAELQVQVRAEIAKPFDLTRPPLWRLWLARTGETHRLLVLTMHHIITDGWSNALLVSELATLYTSLQQGSEAVLPEQPLSYGDYAEWQRTHLAGEALRARQAWWVDHLTGAPELLELPADHARPAAQSFRGATHHFQLDGELLAQLTDLGRRHNTTLFMTLLALFKGLMARLSEQQDLVVGTPVANRDRRELEGIVGLFVNTLALRTDLSGDPNTVELLARVRKTALAGLTHADLPFDQVVEAVQPARNLSYNPVFQVMFTLHNTPMPPLELPGLSLEVVDLESPATPFDLTLGMAEEEGRLRGDLEFNTDLFTRETAVRYTTYFTALTRAALAEPNLPLSRLTILDDTERNRLLYEWNDTAREAPAHATAHAWFRAVATRTPDAIAVHHRDARMSFAELAEASARMAGHLRALGVTADSLVALHASPSPNLLVALLAVLQAGGAFLPVDVHYPAERVSYMLADSGCALVLGDAEALASLETTTPTVDLAELAARTDQVSVPEDLTGGEHTAYLLYTSGSTGKPKGAFTAHAALVRYVRAMIEVLELRGDDRFLQMASISFDVFLEETLPALLAGAATVLLDAGDFLSGPELSATIEDGGITGLEISAAHWFGWVHYLQSNQLAPPACLRRIIIGCEKIQPEYFAYWARFGIPVVHVYGLTETSITNTINKPALDGSNPNPRSLFSIGKPVADNRIYLLDRHLEPVPTGVPGELFIGGAGLARGYVQRPALTASALVPNPFARNDQDTRLYKTGDLAVWLPDGNIEFLGRRDHQVKLRGFRIELGEIEAALAALPSVESAVAMVREDTPGLKRLVAYAVAAADADVASWRKALTKALPDYMVPSAFVVLDELPLTANGKLDRKALPAPEYEANEAVAPRNACEDVLCDIWSEVLGVDIVDVTANFFELGGHSLLATRVNTRINSRLGCELPLRALFEHPTIAGLAELLDTSSTATSAAITPAPRDGRLPLSFAQQRLWFLYQLDGAAAAYNVPAAVSLRGRLDVALLERAVAAVVARHEVLRTRFPQEAGQPYQSIEPEGFRLEQHDLRPLADAERTAEAQRLLESAFAHAFDLEHGPLLSLSLLRLGDEHWQLLLNMSHIVTDAWSMGIFIREIGALLAAGGEVTAANLPELPIQYADYAVWQHQWLQGEELARQRDYWRAQLSDSATVLELPTDRPRPPVQRFEGAMVPVHLDAELVAALSSLARSHGVTLFTGLEAAFALFLARYSGQADVNVGTPFAGRDRAELEHLIGFFVNTLVLRNRIDTRAAFPALLASVHETVLDAFAHQDLPFEQVVDLVQPERNLSHSPLFQVMFTLENEKTEPLVLPELAMEPLDYDVRTAQFDLGLTLFPEGDGLSGEMEYSSVLFERETVVRMAGHFVNLLGHLVREPELPLYRLELMDEAELKHMLRDWNATEVDYPLHLTTHQVFAAQAARTPHNEAVRLNDEVLSYAQLEARANQLAHYLRVRGVRMESVIAICIDNCTDMIAAMLASFKSGASYVPIDPDYPKDRIAFILEDSGASLLLSRDHLDIDCGVPRVLLGRDAEAIAAQPASEPEEWVDPWNNAYAFYTSGSTGKPKRATVHHRALVNYGFAMIPIFELTAADRVLQMTSFGFDVFLEETIPTLFVGGAIILRENHDFINGAELEAVIERDGVTGLEISVAHFHQWVQDLEARGARPPACLRFLLAGCERIQPQRYDVWRQFGVIMINVYGLTEAAITSTTKTLPLDYTPDEERSAYSIGRVVPNNQGYIVDRNMVPTPIGVKGELCIAGEGLGRGYTGRPSLTAVKFVPNPFATVPGDRLYRTGDAVCWLPDGEVDFIGRVDFQVKLRGYRIEPGEIEAALLADEQVEATAVLVREDSPGDKRLVAYLVPVGESVDLDRLRHGLKDKLPEYMVPQIFVMLEAIPLNAHGKLDRKALPVPSADDLAVAYVAPRTPTEAAVAEIMGEVLGLDQVSAEAGFFELGGHSLMATQVIARVRDRFGVELPLRCLFEESTVAGFSRYVDEYVAEGASVEAPPAPVSRDRDLPLSFSQQRLWFLDRLEKGNAAYNIPVAVRLRGELDREALQRALSHVCERHEMLRTHFAEVAGEPVQVIEPPRPLDVPVVDLSADPQREDALAQLMWQELAGDFDYAQGPLMRARLVVLGEREHALLVTIAHIATDGWSMGIMVEEFSAAYAAFHRGEQPELAPLPLQYADYAFWQRARLDGAALDAQRTFWQAFLAGAPAQSTVPPDLNRPARQSFRGAHREFRLSHEVSTKLDALAREAGVTPFMMLFSVLAMQLARYNHSDDVLIGTPFANRDRTELERLIGFFVNTLVLRTDLSGAPSFRELLTRVKAMATQCFAQRDLPFEQVVEAVAPERNLNHTPLFQVMFSYEADPAREPQLDGLEVSSLDGDASTAQFDLLLATERDGDGYRGLLTFNTALYSSARAEQIVAHFDHLCTAAAGQPDLPFTHLAMMDEAERNHLLAFPRAARAQFPVNQCLHERFAALALEAPERVAVVEPGDERVVLSYGDLRRRANGVAAALMARGTRPDTLVGLSAERTADLVVGILGILTAGAAYLPLDPHIPADRFRYIVADSGAELVLTQRGLDLPLDDVETLFIEELGEAPDFEAIIPPTSAAAYAIYTSGSTGKPKGVLVTHANAMRLFETCDGDFGFGPDDCWTLFHSFAFDFSVWELWGALLYGGRLVVVPYLVSREPEAFARLLVDEGVTVLNQTPTAFAQLVAVRHLLPQDTLLRYVVFGGEALDAAIFTPWLERFSDDQPRLINMYGITETTVHVTYARITADDLRNHVGRPLHDLDVYPLDAQGQLVPQFIPGEMHVAGDGLARGYLNRPALTAQRFIPDAFSKVPGSRLYRSGDLGRLLADGNLAYLGRIDHQVKIRGFRIELGEIEQALLAQSSVREVAVLPHGDDAARHLVAFVVSEQGSAIVPDLREALGRDLPAYMVPAAFHVLDRFPLTNNGKLDRRKLLASADQANQAETTTFAAPRNPMESAVADVWAEVLELARVGRDDHFFDLGGHSLLATRLATRLRERLGREVPLARIFETPTVAGLAAFLEGAADEQRVVIGLAPAADAYPLSYAQQRLWFLHGLEGAAAAYNVPVTLAYRGALSAELLDRALQMVAERHATLRTRFPEQDGEPEQRLDAPLPRLVVQDVTSDAEALALCEASAATAFDLAEGPLWRALLLRTAPERGLLHVNMSHIITDAWSIGILVDDLTAAYQLLESGQETALETLPLQYADYAVWQRDSFAAGQFDAARDFWVTRLAELPALLELPTDRPRPALQSYAGAALEVELDAELSNRLRQLARGENTTLFILLQSAFAALLSRYSGQDQVALGTPVANREHGELEQLIGFFVNTLVLRNDLAGNPGFANFLRASHEATIASFTHQAFPFDRLVELLQPERNQGHNPLFQVMFSWQNAPAREPELPGIEMELVQSETRSVQFDLLLMLEEREQTIGGVLEFNTDLFDRGTITRLTRHFQTLLEGIAIDCDQPVNELPLLSEAERRELLARGEAQASFVADHTLAELFEAQVARTPDAVALTFGEQQLRYAELDGLANGLALQLREAGIGPERAVGVYCQRDIALVVSLLAVIKAGGLYVPLDPSYPSERVGYILEDAQAELLLLHESLRDRLPEQHPQLMTVDQLPAPAASAPSRTASSDNAAYIIYTSGSTGKPKGVCMSHGSVVRLFAATADDCRFDERDVWTLFHSHAFDFTVWELWGPLLYGGRLVIVSYETSRSPAEFAALLERERVTVLNQTPSAFYQLMAESTGQARRDYALRLVIFGGEALDLAALAPWFETYGDRAPVLANMYGITETCVHVTWRALSAGDSGQPGSMIGRPLRDLSLSLANPANQVQPLGVAGELLVGGPGLARGYHRRPSLTAQRFVPDAHASRPGARRYRSGDLARYTSAGELEYLGRIDHQVQLRGFRIELGEIEAALSAHAEVGAAVVLIRKDHSGTERLVAWLVPAADAQVPTPAALRAWLAPRLPEYMVPNAFVNLEKMPLTTNGKVDRAALPEPQVQESGRAVVDYSERPVLALLADIWSRVLEIATPARDDNFFDLGGHSLLATRVVSLVRKHFEVEFPLRAFFDVPTLSAMAERIEALRGKGHRPPTIKALPEAARHVLSFSQEQIWLAQQMEPDSGAYNIADSLRIRGPFSIERLERVLTTVAERHEVLRGNVIDRGGKPAWVPRASFQVSATVYDLREEVQGEIRAKQIVAEEMARPFNLAEEMLFRMTVCRLADEEHVLTFVMHHLVSDGWSMGILIDEVTQLYKAFSNDEPSPLAPLPIQFGDFAAWQRQWMSGDVLADHLEYWGQRLSGEVPLLDLPLDRPRDQRQSDRGAFYLQELPEPLCQGIRKLGQERGTTLFMTLLTGYVGTLYTYKQSTDLPVGLTIAGRNRAETENLIGCLINNLVLRFDLSQMPSFGELMGQVRRVTTEAFEYQSLPFDTLLKKLNPTRHPGASPLFQVTFGVQNATVPELDLPGLSLEEFEVGSDTCRYDLTIWVSEEAEGLIVKWTYSTDLFDAETIAKMAAGYESVLRAMIDNPEQQLRDLPRGDGEAGGSERRKKLSKGLKSSKRKRTKISAS